MHRARLPHIKSVEQLGMRGNAPQCAAFCTRPERAHDCAERLRYMLHDASMRRVRRMEAYRNLSGSRACRQAPRLVRNDS